MSDTLYIQTKENVEVHHPHVYLPVSYTHLTLPTNREVVYQMIAE